MNERDLALRWERKPDGRVEADRAIILGSSRVGKSTLANRLVRWFQEDHCRPETHIKRRGRVLVLDEKPRFRATHAVIGPSVRRRYRDFVKGDTIRGVVLDHPAHWDLVWDEHLNPWQTVIVQAPERPEDWVVWLCQGAVDRLFRTQKPGRPTLNYTDEGLSFFGPTGLGRHGSAIQRSYRAGGEKGMVSLLGSQRPTQISPQTKTESNVHFVFALNSYKDSRVITDDLGLEDPPYVLGVPHSRRTPNNGHVPDHKKDKHLFWAYRDGSLLNATGRPFTLPI